VPAVPAVRHPDQRTDRRFRACGSSLEWLRGAVAAVRSVEEAGACLIECVSGGL
jgi:hypothetical protein